MPKHPIRTFTLFCSVCKLHFSYQEQNKADALKKFDACGHDRRKVKQLQRNLGRKQRLWSKAREVV